MYIYVLKLNICKKNLNYLFVHPSDIICLVSCTFTDFSLELLAPCTCQVAVLAHTTVHIGIIIIAKKYDKYPIPIFHEIYHNVAQQSYIFYFNEELQRTLS